MFIVQICIGSSCHLKGSHDIVEKFQENIEKYELEDDVTLCGSFCVGKCNREGVTVVINDDIYTGVTKETADSFFNEKILIPLGKEV